MSTNKHINAICWICTAAALLLTVLFMGGSALGLQSMALAEDGIFDTLDLDDAWSTAGATRITLNGDAVSVSGGGTSVRGSQVTILTAGKYILSGVLEDGCVVVDADSKDNILLLLDGADISHSDGAALAVRQAGKVVLTLAEGKENRLACGDQFAQEAVDSGEDAALYSKDDLSINGSGSLTIAAGYKHGLVCNDSLAITGGSISVTAAKDAIHANDAVRIAEATLTLQAGDDAITCKNDDGTGLLYVLSGSILASECYEGLEGDDITIAGGSIALWPTDDGLNAMNCITVTGGELYIENSSGRDADGLDSNGDIYISGGKLLISVNTGSCALDCGSENGGKCIISGGTVLACGGSSMAEGFDSASPQGFLMTTVSGSAGTSVKLKKADGTTLISATVPCAFSSIVASAPGMQVGDVCVLTVGETATELTIDNQSSGSFGGFGSFGGHGMMGGMTQPDQNGETGGFVMGNKPERGERLDGMQMPGTEGDSDAVSGATPTQPEDRVQGGMQFPGSGQLRPDGLEQPDEMQLPDGMERPDGMQAPEDGQLPENGQMPEAPEDGQTQEDIQMPGGFRGQGGMGGFDTAQQTGRGDMQAAAAGGAEPVSAQSWILLGASVLVLAAGLFIALKFKH